MNHYFKTKKGESWHVVKRETKEQVFSLCSLIKIIVECELHEGTLEDGMIECLNCKNTLERNK